MSTKSRLDQATFEQLLELHGSRTERWPEALREPLACLLESSAAARSRWQQAEELDAWLDAVPEIEPAPDLVARIAALPALHPRPEPIGWWPFANPLAPLLAWGTAAALGVVLGVLATPDLELDLASDAGESNDRVAEVLFAEDGEADDDGPDEWTEVSGLVMGADWAPEDE